MTWTERRIHLGTVARRLTEPAPGIPEGEERRHARVVSVFTLALAGLMLAIGWLPLAFEGAAAWWSATWVGTVGVFLAVFAVSRTVHTRLAGRLFVLAVTAPAVLWIVGLEPDIAAVALVFLVIPTSIAAVVLPPREALAFGVATIAAAAALAPTALDVPNEIAAPVLLFLVLGTTLISLVVEVRRRDRIVMYTAVRELAKSREGFRRLFDDSIVAVLLQEHGELIAANQALADLLGYDRPADLIGKSVLGCLAEECRETAVRHMSSGTLSGYDLVLVRRDGSFVRVEAQGKPLVYEGRTVRLSVVRDVTAEREAQERLQAALETGHMGTWEWDVREDRFRWTGGHQPYVAAAAGAVDLQSVLDVVVEVDRPRVVKGIEDSLATGKDFEAEYRVIQPDGSIEWVVSSGRPVFDENGRAVRMLGVVRVVTERRAAEERYRELFENANDAVFTIDLDWRVTSVNRAGEALLGRDREEIVGSLATDFVSPEYHELAAEQSRLKLAGEAVTTDYELEVLTPGGGRVAAEMSTRLIRKGERPVGFHAIVRDASGRKALEEQLRQAQRLEAVGRLAGGIAHDFNNILTVIDGYNDMLLYSLDPDDARRYDAIEVKRAAERAARLTRQLLAFSRRQVLQPQVLTLNDVVRELQSLLRRTIGEDVSLETALCEDACRVKADRGQLEQVLMNFAVNARDAMPQGGRLTVETACVTLAGLLAETLELPPGEYVELTVRDTGVGMDEETRAQVFEPFFTTKASGEGSGLGLATAYGIVRQSGGQICVQSEPGLGAAFRVLLPAAPPGEEPAPERLERDCPESGSETLLLVEDEASVRRLVRLTLERGGYRVLEAAGGDEALQLAAAFAEPIHLLVTDVVMPGMNGRALAEQLASARPDTRILFMSGYPDDAIVRHGISEADVSFLQKPFSPDDLAEKVRKVLDTE